MPMVRSAAADDATMPQTRKKNDSHETRMRHDLMGFSVDR
jgi:hypothetical protein